MSTLEIFIIVLGATIGSFLNVVIYRVPLGKSIVMPRSSCTDCSHQIKWYENIPILSWLFLRGKCSSCGVKISFIYPLVEVLTAIAAYLSYFYFYKFTGISAIESILVFLIVCSLISHFFIDIKHQILPDGINIFLLTCSFTYCFMFLSIRDSLLGGLLGFLMPLGVTWAYYKLRGVVGLGGGDIKLFGILGLLFGVKGIVLNLFLSCFIGALFSIILLALGKMDRDTPIAFGPFIILTSFVQLFKPDLINQVYDLLLWS